MFELRTEAYASTASDCGGISESIRRRQSRRSPEPSAAALDPRSPAPSPSSGAARSVAVLPLQNLSGDPEFEYFTDGLTEELTAELSLLPDSPHLARDCRSADGVPAGQGPRRLSGPW
jgi:hypothetical protein